MIRCMIVDDEQHAIDLLTLYIGQASFLELVCATTSPVQALQQVQEQRPDLIFLDVQMPDMSGIEFMQLLKGQCKVILTTAYSHYAMEGFEHEVVDYLLKPVSLPRFLKAARRGQALVAASEAKDDDYILVKTEQKGKLQKINISDIVYIEGLKNYVSFYTSQGLRILALLNMKDLEKRLPSERFSRTHKSYILAIRFIAMIEGNTVHLEHTDRRVPIGETFREAFMNRIKGKIMTHKL